MNLFSRDFDVLRSLGTHFTLFFLNLPHLSNLETIVRVIYIVFPFFTDFKSSILLRATVN